MIVRCPKCGHDMRYEPRTRFPASNSKRCVYCGRSFVIRDRIVSSG